MINRTIQQAFICTAIKSSNIQQVGIPCAFDESVLGITNVESNYA